MRSLEERHHMPNGRNMHGTHLGLSRVSGMTWRNAICLDRPSVDISTDGQVQLSSAHRRASIRTLGFVRYGAKPSETAIPVCEVFKLNAIRFDGNVRLGHSEGLKAAAVRQALHGAQCKDTMEQFSSCFTGVDEPAGSGRQEKEGTPRQRTGG